MTTGLLLIHAFPLDARMWETQMGSLGARLPIVAPHLPGFGGTEGPEVLTMSLAAEHCVRTLDEAGVETAIVCGLSMGGYVAFELWRDARPRVAALVLANTRAEPDPPEGAAARRALAERLKAEGHGFLVEEPPPLLSEDAPADLRERVKAFIADQTPAAIAAASLGMAERPDSVPDLPGIDVPTLVITGTADRLIPPDVTAGIAERVPDAELLRIEAAGHLSNLEAPEAFTTALDGVLTALGS
ncbi:MAG TPA: alpha/beta fold hydrolase [Actinomycetota bacterium]|nr:alpha/beta fold hydrolase [Actinomycetota bacterium]